MNPDGLQTHHHAPSGMGTMLTTGTLGTSLAASSQSRARHPWLTTPTWSPTLGRWTATVDPGFVNADSPIFRATVAEQRDLGNPWEINPLTGRPFFSDPIFGQPQVKTITVDVPLYLTPSIALDFRNVGFDGDGQYEVPKFFLNLGAAKAPTLPSADDIANGASLDLPPPPPGLRLLRACDLWLHQPRLALTSSVTLEPGVATGQSNVTQRLGVASPAPSDALRVVEGTFVADTQTPDPLDEDYEEPNFDEILISTVYLLSPPNMPPAAAPDGTWQPYVRHNLFWNLAWAQPTFHFQPPAVDSGIEGLSFLGLGTAAPVINILAAGINDAANQALNILNGHSLAGTFWTPTGGGHVATITQNTTDPEPVLGPDAKKNLAAKLAAARAAQLSEQLDPAFPHTALAFPTGFVTAA